MKEKLSHTLVLVIVSVAVLFVAACSTQPPLQSEFPAAMAEPVRVEYQKMWDKGKILYGITCAKCHNPMVKKKDVVPDFTVQQLQGYEMRIANPEHSATLSEDQMTPEELNLIITFLTYKKKSNVLPRNIEEKVLK